MFPPRLLPIDIIDRAVEGVGRPERGVQGAAGHAVRAEQDVEGVPDDEGEGEEEPEEGERGGGVGPFLRLGGARGACLLLWGFGWRGRGCGGRGGEGCWVGAGGDHGCDGGCGGFLV